MLCWSIDCYHCYVYTLTLFWLECQIRRVDRVFTPPLSSCKIPPVTLYPSCGTTVYREGFFVQSLKEIHLLSRGSNPYLAYLEIRLKSHFSGRRHEKDVVKKIEIEGVTVQLLKVVSYAQHSSNHSAFNEPSRDFLEQCAKMLILYCFIYATRWPNLIEI